MKKLLFVFVLLCTTIAFTQNSGQPANASTPSASKSIADPEEFKMWETATGVADPAGRAAAFEAFLARYPNTVAKLPALLQELAAYQQGGNQEMLQPTAKRILEVDPNNVTALSIDVLFTYVKGQGNEAAAAAASSEAQKALQTLASWKKPDEMSQAEYDDKRKQMTAIFNTAVAFGAFQNKDYAGARDYYSKLIEADPSFLNYQHLGVSDLQISPPDVAGFWYLAKAINQAPDKATAQQIATYVKDRYRRYHGSNEGWDQIVLAAAKQPTLPSDFTVKPKPTECEQVIAGVATVPDAELVTLAVSDWEMVLSHRDCSPEAKPVAQRMWQAIQDKQKSNGVGKLTFDGVKVISATADSLQVAITEKNQQANKADLQVTLEKPFASPPAPGAQLDVVGVVADYTPNPFAFIMQSAEARESKPAAPKKPARPARPGARHRAQVKSALR